MRSFFLLLACFLSIGLTKAQEAVRLNEIQVIGTHNSYHLEPTPPMMALIGQTNAKAARGIAYSHRPLAEQFSKQGIRQIELDLYADPDGGLFAKPLGRTLLQNAGNDPGPSHDPDGLLNQPGMKIIHAPDFDYLTTVLTFKQALEQIRAWSEAHPDHVPIGVLLELKEQGLPLGAKPVPFDQEQLENVEEEILSVLTRDEILTPDDVRGDADTLRQAVLEKGWPTLDAVRGKVLFALDNRGKIRDTYLKEHPSLAGRLLFASVDEEDPAAAWFKINNPLTDFEKIQRLVRAGFMVRTRADTNTTHARENDVSQREKAFASGAQWISTDYPEPNEAFSAYQVRFPNGIVARANPLNGSSRRGDLEKKAAVKNVLFLISDDLRANVLGCYGDPRCQTPNLDALAKQSLVFDRAYCQGLWCAPSRTSLMHSRYQGARPKRTNLGQHFQKHGYYSARAGKIYHMRVPGDIIDGTDGHDIPSTWTEKFNSPGLEAHTPGDYACLNLNIFTKELEGRQSTRMPHRMFVSVEYEGDGSDQPDHKTASKIIELLGEERDKPFFLAAGFVRPHYPMVAPRQYFAPYRWQDMVLPPQIENDLEDIPPLGRSKSHSKGNGIDAFPDNQKRMWAAYYASVTFMDAQVGRILDELDRLGLRESTAIVFTSDHGYHLGDHTFWQKGNAHEEVTRVPLMISVPGMKPGRSESIVELVDLFPTLAELCELPIPDTVQGASLVPILQDPKAMVKGGALSFPEGHAWRTEHWAYLRYKDDTEELYDMQSDPLQITNLVGDPQHQYVLAVKRAQLDARLTNLGLAR